MNIGIDIDGTATKYPEFFSLLTSIWPGKVYIITGLGHGAALEKLGKLNHQEATLYGQLIDTSLYNEEERALIGKVESNEEIVGRFKQRMCKELGVDIMFDDMASIHRQFGDTPIFEVK
jgi:hypothetical protein